MITHTTDVAIIGAGPSGLLLSQLLHLDGISSILVERTSRARVLSRIRAGVLERGTLDGLAEAGVDARLQAERIDHDGVTLAFDGDVLEIPVHGLTGHHVVVYGQTEVTRDLIEAAEARGQTILWDCPDAQLSDLRTAPRVQLSAPDGTKHEIKAQLLAGCDGFHGICRQAIPAAQARVFEREYPFGWLGLLVDRPPVAHNVVYANHREGFALASMRSATRSRYYVQSDPGDRVEDWPEARFWEAFQTRMGDMGKRVEIGPALEMSIAPLRSFVSEPMSYGRMFLAGDAAHIVPPTGAKGLNLAVADVRRLARAISRWKGGCEEGLAAYSDAALARVWKVERFSWYLTKLMHQFPTHSAFEKRMQRAEFDYIASSPAAQTMIAENYVGLDF
ncbi:MAG: 4-hydroxybenzoate 3-monooxygenase [Pseudomonadota bacterium]